MTADEIAARLDAHVVDSLRALAPIGAGDERPSGPDAPVRPGSRLTVRGCLEIFDQQAASRHLDFAARRLSADGDGYYSIGSAGHEGNAAVAAALRPTDPALLHYRSGAFYLARAAQVPQVDDPMRDVLLGVVAAAEDPISGGRHKVFGHPALAIIPQTSTIASHLPRAVGIGFAIERAGKLARETPWPRDAVVVCSFGDASVNHATALAGLNAAAHAAAQGLPVPVLFVCEDNGLGISVRTPPGWIESAWANRPSLRYFVADGCDAAEAYTIADEAVRHVRRQRMPAFLHLRVVRLLGHAGSDVESAYRSRAEMATDLARDPLVGTARLLVESGQSMPEALIDRYVQIGQRVRRLAEQVRGAKQLGSAAEVMEPLTLPSPAVVASAAAQAAPHDQRERIFRGRVPEQGPPLTLAQAINHALTDALAARSNALVFGEDVARKGGVYGVTRGLIDRFGAARVFDTILDETSILGLASGLAISGFLPIPEIQYLAYLHNAEDQIRGEAASLRFFSHGQFANPMVVRIAGLGYQRGIGGHFHNDNSVAVLRDIPRLIVACPARPDDAVALLRTCLAAATQGAVCVVVEPIALYHQRDLYVPGDEGWLARYPRRGEAHAPVGRARTYGVGSDLTIITFGNGVRMSLRVARSLAARHGVGCRVVDLRWLAPLPVQDILRKALASGRVLVADETRRSGGVSEGVLAALTDARFAGPMARVASEDSYVPLGPAASSVLLAESTIEKAALDLIAT